MEKKRKPAEIKDFFDTEIGLDEFAEGLGRLPQLAALLRLGNNVSSAFLRFRQFLFRSLFCQLLFFLAFFRSSQAVSNTFLAIFQKTVERLPEHLVDEPDQCDKSDNLSKQGHSYIHRVFLF